jgi:hypothetical protein
MIQAVIGTFWWILCFFVYIKNAEPDNLTLVDGSDTLPIVWWFERLRVYEDQTNYFYLSVSLASTFATYFLVSFVEVLGYVFYILGITEIAGIAICIIGFGGSLLLYILPWLFACIHIGVTMNGDTSIFPGSWCIYLIVIQIFLWLGASFLHFLYVPRFAAHLAAVTLKKYGIECSCPAGPEPQEIADMTRKERF